MLRTLVPSVASLLPTAGAVLPQLSRSITAWQLYMKENHEAAKNELGTNKIGDIAKHLSQRWSQLSVEQKLEYQQRGGSVRAAPKHEPKPGPRPPNAWNMYIKARMPELIKGLKDKGLNSRDTLAEASKAASAEFKALSDAEKHKYKEQAARAAAK